MTNAKPLLTDLQPTNYNYKDGDRIVVRVNHDPSNEDRKKFDRILKKWARAEVRTWVVNCLTTRVLLHRHLDPNPIVIVEPTSTQSQGLMPGVANIDCSVVVLLPGDLLVVQDNRFNGSNGPHFRKILKQQWAGDDVEIRLETEPYIPPTIV